MSDSSLCPHGQHWPGTQQGLLKTMCPQPMYTGPETGFPTKECFSRVTGRQGEEEMPQGRKSRWSGRGWKRTLYLLETHAVVLMDEVGSLGFPKRLGVLGKKGWKERQNEEAWKQSRGLT